jgi:hypothetical protein
MNIAGTVRYAPSQGALQIKNFTNATNADLEAVAPAIFAVAPHPERTKHTYQFVSTIEMIEAMRKEGWQVTAAGQKFVRDMNRWAYARHFIRMRHQDAVGDEFVPEAIIMNAHDGTASWKYFDGAFRHVCTNGLVWGEIMGSVKAHHTMRQAGPQGVTAIQLSAEFMRVLPEKMRIAERLKDAIITEAQMLSYFARAIAVRWPHGSSVQPADLQLSPWLKDDYGLTMWQVYNHAQRWLVTIGGVQGVNAAGRVYVSAPVKRVDETVRINVGLWNAALDTIKEVA